jgi:hypothetical protein
MEEAPEEMEFFNRFVDKGLLDRLNTSRTSDFGTRDVHGGDRVFLRSTTINLITR